MILRKGSAEFTEGFGMFLRQADRWNIRADPYYGHIIASKNRATSAAAQELQAL